MYHKKASGKNKWKTQKESYSGQGNPNYRGPNTKCNTCGKPIRKSPHDFKVSRFHYCSQECYHRGESYRVRRIVSILICDQCRKKFENKHHSKTRRFCSRKCFEKWYSENHRGENSHSWKGGVSPYPAEWNEKLRRKIRHRDGYKCQDCGLYLNPQTRDRKYERYALDVHHINGDKRNCSDSNLVTLCHSCHLKRHAKTHA